jgi:hypothetical protein
LAKTGAVAKLPSSVLPLDEHESRKANDFSAFSKAA